MMDPPWCDWPMFRNVRDRLYPDGPWPVLPTCALCRPEGQTLSTTYQLIDPSQIVVPACSDVSPAPQWDGKLYVIPGGGCNLNRGSFQGPSRLIGNWTVGGTTVFAYEHVHPLRNGYFALHVLAACTEYGEKVVWSGRKYSGPTAAGVYDAWRDTGNSSALATIGPDRLTIMRL